MVDINKRDHLVVFVLIVVYLYLYLHCLLSTLQPEDLQTRGLQQQPLLLGGTSKSIDDED